MAPNPLRMRRLFDDAGHCLMLPLDHGASLGALPGLTDVRATLATVADVATCTTLHRGLVGHAAGTTLGVLMHLSASTSRAPDPDEKRLVAGVEDAIRRGCDGVSIHINLGSRTEARQVEDAGRVASACDAWGMPLVAMVYPRGGSALPDDLAAVAHGARLGAELGADAVKVPYCEGFRDVVQAAGVPVLVAGGPDGGLDAWLDALGDARRAGARGASVGRHVFGSDDPRAVMERVAQVFR